MTSLARLTSVLGANQSLIPPFSLASSYLPRQPEVGRVGPIGGGGRHRAGPKLRFPALPVWDGVDFRLSGKEDGKEVKRTSPKDVEKSLWKVLLFAIKLMGTFWPLERQCESLSFCSLFEPIIWRQSFILVSSQAFCSGERERRGTSVSVISGLATSGLLEGLSKRRRANERPPRPPRSEATHICSIG